ncbi:MAG TPA: serine hydrolase domain-containing protein [Parafilimonas sp.]|nr:serine hydrolase domain-containing protein [Parafilimonas sp.]
MRHLTTLLLLPGFIICTNTAQTQSHVLIEAPAAAGGFSTERLVRLDSAMNDWVKNKWTNGAVALIARDGKIVYDKAYGYNDVNTKTPLDKNGIFRIASQTKAITSVAAMILWEEGKFSLEDPVSKYIPGFANERVLDTYNPKDTTFTTVPAKRPVTILDLLTHTSGLGYPAIGTAEENAIYAKYYITGGVGTKGQTMADAFNRLGKLPLFFQPGTQWKYSLGADVVGYLIQVWSGMSLEDFFTKNIFEPLGMHDTYFNVPASKGSRLVNFFVGDSSGNMQKQASVFGGALDMNYPLEHTDYFSGGGGLSSTITDYAIFLQMLLNGGEYNGVRLLAPSTVKMMTENQIGDLTVNIGNSTGAKFGFGVAVVPEHGYTATPSEPGTFAWGGVFSTTYWVDPKEHLIGILYEQIWGPYVAQTQKLFHALVYQAMVN